MSNNEQILTTVAGGVIGFFVGGPVGAAKGALYGYQAGALLFPEPLPDGPRLKDVDELKLDPGTPLTIIYGTDTTQGVSMYLGPVAEVATTEDSKGGPEQTKFDYYQTYALHLNDGVISGVCRIWENGELKYDVRPQQPGEVTADYDARIAMSEAYEAETGFVVYRGTESQLPDPTIESEQGIGTIPAYRGDAYIVYPNRHLKQGQGQRHPRFKFEVVGRGETIYTSRPYPYLIQEEMWTFAMPVKGGTWIPPEDELDTSGTPIGGVLDSNTFLSYTYDPVDDIDITGSPIGGVLSENALLTYTYDPVDDIDVTGIPIGGLLDTVLLTYNNYDPESLDVTGTPISGSLD